MQQFSIRVPEEIYQWLKQKAESESRSLNGQVNHLLRQLMQQEEQDELSTEESKREESLLEKEASISCR